MILSLIIGSGLTVIGVLLDSMQSMYKYGAVSRIGVGFALIYIACNAVLVFWILDD